MRKLKRTFGISAPRVAVRAAMPWYVRWLGLIGLALAVLLLARATYDFGKKFAGFDQNEADSELRRLVESNNHAQLELAQLRADVAQREQQVQMERATYADLVKQMKSLTEENATLKEDLAFFQTLMPSGGKDGGVAVSRFLVQNDVQPGSYRYLLLVTQTGQRTKDFLGYVQFTVNLQQDNKKAVMSLPAEDSNDAMAYKLNFRFYQRVEGTFRIAPGAAVKSIQLRVFEQGSSEPKLTQTANVS